nr:V-type proton ATPase subunit S1-like protein isoform X1 [Oryctolagus cuniculus]XP_008260116.2 V-type proton ATPase subunit S1-like protein isoform X1 [Oryctolagus cuniculus]XP_017200051.2 V-type proton ATPase subunit S1-like protein isoform X1 [Oryctolagus cuniculus]XP_051709586.1 V-type proton ATPase subunit S1-like protein isoform X1 [Oryctolagus cuniculus]XP_051709587.1 V-type proton ATPase subunit S1-like protein isoform X1 [Oryctolagus cuniculus]XP_051709588.1 V-type proton ATPase subu
MQSQGFSTCVHLWGCRCAWFEQQIHFLMGRKILFYFALASLCMGLSLTLEQILARKNASSQTSSDKEVVIKNDQENNASMTAIRNSTTPVAQALNDTLSREGHLEKQPWNAFGHQSPVNVSIDGIPCILFWARRITVKFKNQTWLDLAEEAFGQKAMVDIVNSNCSEESATLSLKFGGTENLTGLVIRFVLTNYNKLSIQSWFSLHRVEMIFNNSVRATFNATGIYAPSSYSYHCHLVSSLQGADALLLPSDPADMASLWEVSFTDFQIQGFTVQGARFAKARDCASAFSPAILMGLATSLVLLLVLAYVLHMLTYLRALDQHYECLTSPARFPPLNAGDAAEKELLRSQGADCYELRSQPLRKVYA